MTRTEAISRTMLAELRRRRQVIDGSSHLASVEITVYLQAGPDPVRSVVYGEHRREARRR